MIQLITFIIINIIGLTIIYNKQQKDKYEFEKLSNKIMELEQQNMILQKLHNYIIT